MSQIKIRPLAENDLVEIWLYLAEHSQSIANKAIERFDQKFQLLSKSPNMGRLREELSVKNLRSFPVDSYTIFYIPFDKGVEIVRILHSKRDVEAIIDKS